MWSVCRSGCSQIMSDLARCALYIYYARVLSCVCVVLHLDLEPPTLLPTVRNIIVDNQRVMYAVLFIPYV
jgi:hypothetical protein